MKKLSPPIWFIYRTFNYQMVENYLWELNMTYFSGELGKWTQKSILSPGFLRWL